MARMEFPKSLLRVLVGILLAPVLLTDSAVAGNNRQLPLEVKSNVQLVPPARSPGLLAQKNTFSSFFEDGRILATNQLSKQLPDPILPTEPTATSWQPMLFKEGGISFSMPSGPLTEETVVLPTRVGAVGFRALTVNFENTRYVVAYANQLTDDQLKKPQALLTAIINRVISAPNFKLVYNRPIRLSISRGRELSYESASDVIVFRAYLKRDRIYVIGARTPKSNENPSQTTISFLKSFQFVTLQSKPGA